MGRKIQLIPILKAVHLIRKGGMQRQCQELCRNFSQYQPDIDAISGIWLLQRTESFAGLVCCWRLRRNVEPRALIVTSCTAVHKQKGQNSKSPTTFMDCRNGGAYCVNTMLRETQMYLLIVEAQFQRHLRQIEVVDTTSRNLSMYQSLTVQAPI